MTLNNMHGKALGIARVLCQLVKMFYIHAAEPRAVDTPAFELQVDPPVGNAARSSNRWLFFRHLRFMTRAYRSPNTPFNWEAATNPGNVNRERIDWGFFSRY